MPTVHSITRVDVLAKVTNNRDLQPAAPILNNPFFITRSLWELYHLDILDMAVYLIYYIYNTRTYKCMYEDNFRITLINWIIIFLWSLLSRKSFIKRKLKKNLIYWQNKMTLWILLTSLGYVIMKLFDYFSKLNVW